jgi:hypothetical protein
MAIRITNWRWLEVNRQPGEGGQHDGTYRVQNIPGGGKLIILLNGPNLGDGTVIKLTTAADVTNFSNAVGDKHK